ncbi:stereocilin [Pangasianodon hypophthalmus]|uniref:stereocilin n=1 Tax=Pangasianodon hypophthalmus TaxID=310915 RepID=UPI00230736DE|nr:stereocilin [Pangasianodon hypophthalmus]
MALRMGKFGIVMGLIVLLGEVSTISEGNKKKDQREAVLKELVEIWRKGGGWYPRREQPSPERGQDEQIHTVLRNIVGGLKSLGLLPKKAIGLPSLNKPLDRNRLSGFLYNISMYLQEMSAELDDDISFSDDHFWENLLHSFLQSDGKIPLEDWAGRVPPRPSFRLQDLFLSLRGSPHWDGLLGLVQSILTLIEQQPQRPLLTFVSQNWKTISALLDTALQALVSGTYSQANAGLQGFICVLKGQSDCAFNLSWLQQLLTFLEARNWKPMVNLHPAGVASDHRDSNFLAGRFKPFSIPPEILREVNNKSQDIDSLSIVQALLLQALSKSNSGERAVQFAERNPDLVQGLDGLRRGFLHRVGSTVYSNLRRKVSRVTIALLDDLGSMAGEPQSTQLGKCSVGDLRQLILWGIRHNLTWNAQAMGFTSHGLPSRPSLMSCSSSETEKHNSKQQQSSKRSSLLQPQPLFLNQTESELPASAEILEAACNASIPGLTGVSNFTVFLYCNLFDGADETLDPEAGHVVPDLHVSCSNAAWYLSAAEEDFLWVHVCSEFFAQDFNNTVCANSSFWLQRAHQAAVTKDYHYLNQSSIDDLCIQLSSEVAGSSTSIATEDCLELLSARSLSAQDFRRCFLPNNSALILALCGNVSYPLVHTGWAAEYCSKILNKDSHHDSKNVLCDFLNWTAEHFTNSDLLELCGDTAGLRDYICKNMSLYVMLVPKQPVLLDYCNSISEPKQETQCVLQQLFNMLPAPYDFDTHQLCINPIPILQEAVYKLNHCEGVVDERVGWLATVSYVLQVLDFVVGLSAGLEEGEREVRQGLGQAILLSRLLDNSSFWGTLRPDASVSVLQTVGVFLRREQNLSLKEELLSCFSPVLWDLIQKEDNSSALRFLIQEYLQMPRERIRTLVLSAEKDAVKRFLSHVHQSWDQLQVETTQASPKEKEAMETMTAAFIHKFPRVTPELFVDLSQFIPYMSVSDIMNFPASLIANDSVLMAIRDHSSEMKSPQKQAFAKRLLQSNAVGDVSSWPPYFLTSVLPLLPHLPVSHFQQLTSQQLSPLVELLANSSLDAIRGRHVLRTLFSKRKNLTSDTIMRLGILICYVNSEELHRFLSIPPVSPLLWQQLAQCISDGHVSGNGRLSHWLALSLKPLNASSLSSPALASLHGVLPQLGSSFLQPLSSNDLLELFSQPDIPTFPPAQAFQILNKIFRETNISANTLCKLKPLFQGLAPAFLKNLTVPDSMGMADCQCWSSLLSDLQPAHRAMVHSALQQLLEHLSTNKTLYLHCLLPFISLKKLATELDGQTILHHIPLYRNMSWSPQQAQLLYRMIQQAENVTRDTVLHLGRIASGMSCKSLQLWANDSDFSELLRFITALPGRLRPALRKCVVEELRKRPDVDLDGFDPSFAAGLPVTMIERLSNASLSAVLNHLRRHFIDFLELPRHKQMTLAEKAIDVLMIAEDRLSGASMDLLGPLLFFLDRDMLSQVDREALKLRLEDLKQYCMPSDTFREMASLLTERSMLGEPKSWTVGDVEHVDRLVFTLSPQLLRSLQLDDLDKDTVEQVLQSQWHWKDTELGKVCADPKGLKDKIYSLIHKIIRGRRWSRREPIPICADIKGTFPSAWRWYQLNRMKRKEMKECVEFLGQDGSLDAEQRWALWTELRPVYKPVRTLRPEQILELGCIITEMSERELQAVNLSDLAVVAHVGSFKAWNPRKMRAALQGFLRRRKEKPEDLGVVELVSLGNLLCGFTPTEISRLDPFNLSMAAMFLRETFLSCSEHQTEALTARLSSPLAFGPVSGWSSEIFTEIGTLAAGLDDIVLSSLVREQIEGLTPLAISLIPPKKMAVVFSASQLSWLSSEQAWAVTDEQWQKLDNEQKQALSMALYEGDVMLGHRGRNQAPSVWFADNLKACTLLLLCTLLHLL